MTKKKIARTTKGRKRPTKTRAEKPLPAGLVERAAERAGVASGKARSFPTVAEINARLDAAGHGLTAEDKTILDERRALMGTRTSADVAEQLIREARMSRLDSQGVAAELRCQAHELDRIAERLRLRPETERSMLADALEVLGLAENTFYHQGEGANPMAILREALRSARNDLDLLRTATEGDDGGPDWQAFTRAESRLALALKLAAFREKHGYHNPMKAGANDETEGSEPAKVAS